LEVRVGNLIDPCGNDFSDDLPACFTPDGFGYDADRVLWFDEAK
jgi:hypothetical protein